MPTLTSFPAALLAALPDGGHTFGSVALAILGIGLLIFVHEGGHFLACRLTKTRVETFSMGFGPRLFGWESRDGVRRFTVGPRRSPATEGTLDFRISAIPLGGYVKMAGEIGGDGGGGASGGARAPLSDEFPAKPFLSRAFIISAGVIMNLISAFVLLTVAYGKGIDEMSPYIGGVSPGDAAWEADLRAGDRIEAFGGAEIRTFREFREEVLFSSSGASPQVTVLRGEEHLTFPMKPRADAEKGAQMVGVSTAATWIVKDGTSPTFTVGPTDAVTVDGRPVVGGAAAVRAVEAAWRLGKTSVRIEVGPKSAPVAHEVRLPVLSKAGTGWRLGVAAAPPLVVDKVRPKSLAEKAGVKPGDRLVSVDGVPVRRDFELGSLPRLETLVVSRDGKAVSLPVGAGDPAAVSAFLDGIARTGKPEKDVLVVVPEGRELVDGASPAALAGLKAGDAILEVGGKKVATPSDLTAIEAASKGEPVSLQVRGEDGSSRELQVTPKPPADLAVANEFFSGEVPHEVVSASGPLDALSLAAARTGREVRNIFRLIGRFIGGEISPAKNLGGPGTIVNLSSSTVSLGLAAYLSFLAFISINLAVLNILPIPVLDGGTLLLLVIEKLRGGRPLKESTIASLQWVGFALLMLLMVYAVKNDFLNLSK